MRLSKKYKGKRQHITPYKRIILGINEAIKEFNQKKDI